MTEGLFYEHLQEIIHLYDIIKGRGKDGGKETNAYFVPGTVLVFLHAQINLSMLKYYRIIISISI